MKLRSFRHAIGEPAGPPGQAPSRARRSAGELSLPSDTTRCALVMYNRPG